MTYWVIIYGDPVSGFGIVGPFNSKARVDLYATEFFEAGADWWIVELEPPNAPWSPLVSGTN